MADNELDADGQDQAEVFDETNITEDGRDIAHPDMALDVYDVTRADDDEDDTDNLDDFDPDEADEADLETMLEADDGVDEARVLARDDADEVLAEDESPAKWQGGSDDDLDSEEDEEDDRVDTDLEETFPASDPAPMNPGST